MIVYNSMLVLVFLLMTIYNVQQPSARIRHSRPIPWRYAIISMGYIVFWAALRSGFVDTSAYIRWFLDKPETVSEAFKVFASDTKDKGFDFIQIIFKSFVSHDFHFWLAFVAIATAVPIVIVYRNRSCDYLYSIYLFITSTTVIWMFNGIRQFLAAAILFGFGYLIEDRKLIKFLIVLIICVSIHGTAIILLPMYFFVIGEPFNKRMIIFILAVLACTISIAPLLNSMETVLADTAYIQNINQFAEDDGVHPLRVLFSCIPVFLAFLRRKQIIALNNRYVNMCVNMSTVGAGLYFVGMLTSGIMVGRLPIYFSLYSYVLLPYLFNYVYKDYKKLLYIIISIVYLTFYYLMCNQIYYISDILGNYA